MSDPTSEDGAASEVQDLPDLVEDDSKLFETFEIIEGTPYVIAGVATVNVAFESVEGVDYATLTVAPRGGRLLRKPLMDSGLELRFHVDGITYDLTVVAVYWRERRVSCVVTEA